MVDIEGHIQKDPLFREQAQIYSSLGGDLPIKIFSSISGGENMNELASKLIDFNDRWREEGNFQTFEMQARDIIEDLDEENLVQLEDNGWALTEYGQQWRAQLDSANQTLLGLVADGELAASRFEAEDRQVIYNGEETLGDFYHALGFNVGQDAYPEALPALYILAEGVNDGVIPADYEDGVEQLHIMGMVKNMNEDGSYEQQGDSIDPEITEVGQRVYDEVVLDDREFVAEHYGLN